ncbi:uncharacterized protein LOC144751206 [Ciona intestinalis]
MPDAVEYEGYEFTFYNNEGPTDRLTFHDANQVCMDGGGTLAEIKCSGVQDMITNQLNGLSVVENSSHVWSHGYWIGGKCKGGKNNWVWGDGTIMTYQNWYNGDCGVTEPNKCEATSRAMIHPFNECMYQTQLCTELCTDVLGTWGDDDKDERKNWICMKDIDDCTTNPCMNNGTCTDGMDSYTCTCIAGYTGANCTTDIDDCVPNPCMNNGTCTDGMDSYTCTCVAGYIGANCTNSFFYWICNFKLLLTDIDDCATNPCMNNGTCTDGVDSYTCICVAGYTGANCTADIDDCAPNPCSNGGTCTDGINNYTCKCAVGYTGATCTTNIDDCATNPCMNNGTCTDGVDNYTCVCVAGYTGANCTADIDDCAPNPCSNGGTCTDGVDNYTCVCGDGYTGANCTADIDDCATNPCMNNGTCTDGVDSYTCVCVAGYTGANCTADIDDCAPNPCMNNGTCTDGVDKFTCTCMDGYNGDICETDQCQPNPCIHGTCNHTLDGYKCVCQDGFVGNYCETDLCESNPCYNNGSCVGSAGSFTCECQPAFTGKLCNEAKFEENELNNNLLHINYQVSSFSSFSEASDRCKLNKQAGLVIIKDLQTQQIIENQTSSMYNGEEVQLWIGAKKTKHGWFWLDGSHMTFQYWSETGRNVVGSCLKMISQSGSKELRWVPGDCDETIGYICEQPNKLCSSQSIIVIVLSGIIGFLLLVVIATVLIFVRNIFKQSPPDDAVYECIEDFDYNIENSKLWKLYEELSSNSNVGFIIQFADMARKLDFTGNIDSKQIFKIPTEQSGAVYVNEENPRFYPKVKLCETYGPIKVLTNKKKCFNYFSIVEMEAVNETNEYESVSQKIMLFEFNNWSDYDVFNASSRFVWFANKVSENLSKISDSASVIVYGRSPQRRIQREFDFLQKSVKHEDQASVILYGDCGPTMVCVTFVDEIEKFWMKIFVENPDLIVTCDKTKVCGDVISLIMM